VCVLLCFIKPILGNRYGPGVSSRASQGIRTHDWESPTYHLTHDWESPTYHLLPYYYRGLIRQPGGAGSGHGGFLYRSPSEDIRTGGMGDPSGRRSPVPAGHTTRAGGVHIVLEQEASLPALLTYRQFLVLLVYCNVARLALTRFLQ